MNDIPEPEARVASPRSAWTLALRAEVLRVGGPDMARVGTIGIWLASYADADGGSCFPSLATIAALAGCSQDSASQLVRVLLGVGMLGRRRRPNQSSVYQLLIPTQRPDWDAHMHHYAASPKRRAYAKKKAADLAARQAQATRNPPVGVVRNPPTAVVPEPAGAGGSGPLADAPEPADGRVRNPPTAGFRNPPVAGGTCTDLPAVGTPTPDTSWFGPRPQPPVARASPLRIVSTSPGSSDTGSSQPPLLMSAPTEQLPEPDTPDPLRCQDCGSPRGWRPDGSTLCAPCRNRARTLDTG